MLVKGFCRGRASPHVRFVGVAIGKRTFADVSIQVSGTATPSRPVRVTRLHKLGFLQGASSDCLKGCAFYAPAAVPRRLTRFVGFVAPGLRCTLR